jgi:protein arginine kinase activator
MLCDHCGEREATHHDVVVSGGQIRETHLCEVCAAKLGVGGPGNPVGEFLASVVLGSQPATGGARPAVGPARCEHCGQSFAEFKNTGLMGCAGCYEAFEARLVPLLERAHEGGNRHVGKRPRRALSSGRVSDAGVSEAVLEAHRRADRIERLRRELGEAVRAEEYERAARLRDELAALTNPASGSGG